VRNGGDGSRREEGSYYLLPSVGVELTDVEPEVVSGPVPPDLPAVVLQGAMRRVTNSTPTMVPVTPAFRRSRIRGRSIFRASSGRASLAQVVSLTGGIPVTRTSSDYSRMSTKNQRLRKSSTFFIHFKSMK
jgi:hypothetical protein